VTNKLLVNEEEVATQELTLPPMKKSLKILLWVVNIRDFYWFFHLRQAIWPWNHRNFWLTNLCQTNVASLLESLQVLHVSTILCKPCNFDHLLIKNKERKSNQYQHSFPNSNLKPQKYSSPWMHNEQIIPFDDHKQLCNTIVGNIFFFLISNDSRKDSKERNN
jgi:hypothetical protein